MTPDRRKNFAGQAALLLTALIWGAAFAAQKMGMNYLSPQIFTTLRMVLGTLILLPVIAVMDHARSGRISFWGGAKTPQSRRRLLLGGLCCGAVLTAATLTQQWGLIYATAGKAGFLTALYILMVPLIGLCFGKQTSPVLWGAVVIALAGAWLLCSKGGGSLIFNFGDVMLLVCAFLFSLHIMVIDRAVEGCDAVRLSALQFAFGAVFSGAATLICRDTWNWEAIRAGAIPLLYCGLLSNGAAYTLQMVGQKWVHPVTASLLMSLESVFSAIGGAIILHEVLSAREIAGCAIIFCAVILVQLPVPESFRKGKRVSDR